VSYFGHFLQSPLSVNVFILKGFATCGLFGGVQIFYTLPQYPYIVVHHAQRGIALAT